MRILRYLLPISLLCSQLAFAVETVKVQTKNSNAEVYDRPSFSGKVLERLQIRSVLVVHAKKVVGPDGIGAFYEFKNSAGTSFFIADSEVIPAVAIKPTVMAQPMPPPAELEIPEPSVPAPALAQPKVKVRPIVSGNSADRIGVGLGMINYAEKYNETRFQASRISLGFKHQSSFSNTRNFGTELNLAFSPGAPKFLIDAGASGPSGGYLLIADYKFTGKIALTRSFQIEAGAGLALINSKFNTTLIDEAYTSESTRLGAVIDAGLNYTLPTFSFVVDVQQHIEKESYLGTQVSFLFPF